MNILCLESELIGGLKQALIVFLKKLINNLMGNKKFNSLLIKTDLFNS
ncbi:hypothetical protein AB995_0724 [Lactococcus cremoris]|nr:hypothetical protein AB995_0724 [Lactococcus cremoris]KZK41171.1 hypothetical protein LMG6897_1105 [Lactococcus cremoris]